MAVFREELDTRTRWLTGARDRIVEQGQALISDWTVTGFRPCVLNGVILDAGTLLKIKKTLLDPLTEYADRLAKQQGWIDHVTRYIGNFLGMGDLGNARLVPLLAVRAVVSAVADTTINVGTTGSLGTPAHIGVPGVGIGLELSDEQHGKIETATKLVLVPYLTLLDSLIEAETHAGALDPDDIFALYAQGLLEQGHARKIFDLTPGNWEQAKYVAFLRREQPTPFELVQFARRTGKTAAWLSERLQGRGAYDPEDRGIWNQLFDFYPPISDLLRFAQRNVYDPEILRDFKLDDEFARFWQGPLRAWMVSQGVSEEVAQPYWRAHWVTASIGLAQQALIRLRPGRVPQAMEYGRTQFENSMRENDVLPYWRDRLAFLAHSVPGLRQIRQLRETGVWTQGQVESGWEDLGYEHRQAVDLAQALEYTVRRAQATQSHGLTPQEMQKELVEYGIDESTVRTQMTYLGFSDADANALITTAKTKRVAILRKKKIAAIERAFVTGAFTEATARGQLALIVTGPTDVDDLIAAWTVDKAAHVHVGTLTELAGWYRDGTLSAAEYVSRLMLLNYQYQDALRILKQVQDTMDAAQRKAATKAANDQLRAAAKIARANALQAAIRRKFVEAARKRALKLWSAEQEEQHQLAVAKHKEAIHLHLDAARKDPSYHSALDHLAAQISGARAEEKLLQAEEQLLGIALEEPVHTEPVPDVPPSPIE